jgi:hypothetical protein
MKQFRISHNHYGQVRKHLFPGDNCEAVAVAICGSGHHHDRTILTVMDVMLIPYELCTERTSDRVTWPTEILNPLIQRAKEENLSLVKIHCHPGGGDFFSKYDDISDNELFEHIYAWTAGKKLHGSCIMLPDGRVFGRWFDVQLSCGAFDRISVAGPDILLWSYDDKTLLDQRLQKRNLQAFGKGTMAKLGSMKIGVVGCSGTGSPVIEQLKRYGVGHLVVVDPDHVDLHNLNRIIGSTYEDATNQRGKTEIVEREIAKAGFKTVVTAFSKNIASIDVVKELSTCDLLVGCVDSVEGRHILNLISSYYLIPYIDLGVKLDATGDGDIDGIYGTVHYITPGFSSLLSRGQYTSRELEAAAMKRANKEAYLRNQYLAAVSEDTPAVITVNMFIAALAVNELLARIHHYRFFKNAEADAIRVHFHLGQTFLEQYPEPCQFFSKNVGRGDTPQLLDYLALSDEE